MELTEPQGFDATYIAKVKAVIQELEEQLIEEQLIEE